jgi:hypothetical protein
MNAVNHFNPPTRLTFRKVTFDGFGFPFLRFCAFLWPVLVPLSRPSHPQTVGGTVPTCGLYR